MALLWLEGFESFGTTIGNAPAPANVVARKWPTVVSESFFDIETGRGGSGRSMQIAISNGRFHTPAFGTDRTLIVGFAFKYPGQGNAYLCNLFANGSWGMTLYLDGTGGMHIRTAPGGVLGTCGFTFKQDKWYWIEWKVYVDNSAGTVEVRVGGNTVLNLTGVDTQHTAYNYLNQINFKDNTGAYAFIDDVYVCDGSGSDNNDFLGNGIVECLRPDGTDSAGWVTSSPSATHSDNVDEAESDDNTSYVQDNTANAQDMYTYDNLSSITTVKGLHVNTMARTNTGVSETVNTVIDSSGTEAQSGNSFSSTSFINYSFVSEQDPNASAAWTPTTVNAAKFGIKYI